MFCPFCGTFQVTVTNSRPTLGGSQIWRRRKCLKCGETFTTYERINLSHLIIIKKSGQRQRYNRAKLYSGIYRSSIDRKNLDKGAIGVFAEEATNKVEREIVKLKRKKIHSTEITEIVLKILEKKAPDTLLRFLAYREGDDTKKLKSLLKKHLKNI
ncbi:transcriptional repressor NrdR [Candidatus Microgenomates bacterium]|nr:transcriptional repressor NrdR [Candidatus Microgenomates bacterium]